MSAQGPLTIGELQLAMSLLEYSNYTDVTLEISNYAVRQTDCSLSADGP